MSTNRPKPSSDPNGEAEGKSALPIATRLANYCLDPGLGVDLFKDLVGEAYITAPVNGIRQTWPIQSPDCYHWLTRVFNQVEQRTLSATARTDARDLLVSQARFGSNVQPVHIRVGTDGTNCAYLDLCNDAWQAIQIAPGDWRVLDESPVRFRRSPGMLPVPSPDPTIGLLGLNLLQPILNVRTTDGWLSILAWLTNALLPSGPYGAIMFSGPPGSAKSTASKVLRSLVDPAAAAVRGAPRNEDDFFIAAHNSWVMTTDNLSYVPGWMSDALCRLTTGGGFAKRRLYSDSDEVQISVCRPVLLNAIEDVITRSDLLERLLTVELSPIDPTERRRERDLWAEFDRNRPQILGGLLTLTAQAMAMRPHVDIPAPPRMADFAHWGEAVARVLGNPPGRFMDMMAANAGNAAYVSLGSSPLFAVIERYMQPRRVSIGTATELLTALELVATDDEKRHRCWPGSANKLSGMLQRMESNMRLNGIGYAKSRTAGERRVVIWWIRDGIPPELS